MLRLAGLCLIAASLAAEPAPALHFKPADHALGDVHPFFHEGECFLYYLKPGSYASALVRSTDLLRWTPTELTREPATADAWTAPYFVLGVFQDPREPLFRSFFGHAGGRMASSVSRDLRHWASAPRRFHVPPADYYQRRRDPFVFALPDSEGFGCVMTTWLKGRPKEQGGAISLATSKDLQHWRDHGAILDLGGRGEPECPQMFQLGGRWHLLASIYDRAVGQPAYWTAPHPTGPWPARPAGVLDGKDLCAAQIGFDGATPLLFGWIPLEPARPGRQTWGGHLALAREVHALADGRLATRLAPRVRRLLESPPVRTLADTPIREAPLPLPGLGNRQWLSFQVRLSADARRLRLRLGALGEVLLGDGQLQIRDAAGSVWSERPADLPRDRRFEVLVVIDGPIVELFVDDRHSLAARLPAAAAAGTAELITEGGPAELTGLQLRDLDSLSR